jgi:transposase
VRNARLWVALLGVTKTSVQRVEFDQDRDVLVAYVRPTRSARGCCGRCGRRSPGYDSGSGRRRWRALDLGTVQVFVEADSPRVRCRDHGVTVAGVPWARHDAGHTYLFDDTVAWLAVQCSRTAVQQVMRVAWRTVGAVVARVSADALGRVDVLADLRRIGIDEISYKKGQRYITVVVNHDTRRLVWASVGRDRANLHAFFDALGGRCGQIAFVSSDSADWIEEVVRARVPDAVHCADPFHVVQWAQTALDEVRRVSWNTARGALNKRRGGRAYGGTANQLVKARHALWKNPARLTTHQQAQIAWIAKTDPALHRAYLLKEGLRHVFELDGDLAIEALDRWLSWARRARLPSFRKVIARVAKHRAQIEATLEHRLTNGLIESTNTKIRLLTRLAFGFHNPQALIGLAMLSLAGICPPLPGRIA